MEGDRTKRCDARVPRPRPRQAALVIEQGPRQREVLAVDQVVSVIGRGEEADIRICHKGLSRAHARIIVAGSGVVNLVDLSSTNGTFVNGARVEFAVLQEGDRVQLGSEVTLRFTYDPTALVAMLRERSLEASHRIHADSTDLTKRQLEVARLVAQGLTNADVAQALGISLRTVTTHLDHIYDRVGIRSRAALAWRVAEWTAASRDGSEH